MSDSTARALARAGGNRVTHVDTPVEGVAVQGELVALRVKGLAMPVELVGVRADDVAMRVELVDLRAEGVAMRVELVKAQFSVLSRA